MSNDPTNAEKGHYTQPGIDSKWDADRWTPDLRAEVRRATGWCAARRRDGQLCRKAAGWGTDHVGRGACRLHGGAGGAMPGNTNAQTHGFRRAQLLPHHRPGIDKIHDQVDQQLEGKADVFWVRDLVREEIKYCMVSLQVLEREYSDMLQLGTAITSSQWARIRQAYEQARYRWFGRLQRLVAQYPKALEAVRELGLDDDETIFQLGLVPPGADPDPAVAAAKGQLVQIGPDAPLPPPGPMHDKLEDSDAEGSA